MTAIAIAFSTISVAAVPAAASGLGAGTKAATERLEKATRPVKTAGMRTTCGGASWYSLRSRTASGEMMNPMAMTAAHKSLPLGSLVRVTNLRNGRSVVVKINDRGPFVKGRILDLSKGAAHALDFIDSGVARVQIEPADGSGAKSCA